MQCLRGGISLRGGICLRGGLYMLYICRLLCLLTFFCRFLLILYNILVVLLCFCVLCECLVSGHISADGQRFTFSGIRCKDSKVKFYSSVASLVQPLQVLSSEEETQNTSFNNNQPPSYHHIPKQQSTTIIPTHP